jgi:hypothetical protein
MKMLLALSVAACRRPSQRPEQQNAGEGSGVHLRVRHDIGDRDGAGRRDSALGADGRLSPGVGMAQASAAVSAVTAGLAKEYPATNELKSGIVLPYHAVGNTEASDVPIMMAVCPRPVSAVR